MVLGIIFVTQQPVAAVDGVKLIGQPRATAFPFTIDAPDSYRLKANITLPNADTTAILVTVDDVTIDLNGFSIIGGTVCSGSPTVTSCSPTGSGNGIDGNGVSNTTVMNGIVRGMGNVGVVITAGRVKDVNALSNGGVGISDPTFGFTTTVTNCTANSNGSDGIAGAAKVIDSTANHNHFSGIASARAVVSNASAFSNGANGIGSDSDTAVINSAARNNAGHGIVVGAVQNSRADNNGGSGITASAVNGCAASGNSCAGITAPLVSSPLATGNGGAQLNMPRGIAGHNMCDAFPCP